MCWFSCSWISNNTVAISSKVCLRQIQNSAPFFVTPWPTSRTLVDVLDVLCLRARCSQAMYNLQILDIFLFPAGPAHSTRLPTHLIRVPKEGLALQLPISSCGWATPTLKSIKLCHTVMTKDRATQSSHKVMVTVSRCIMDFYH